MCRAHFTIYKFCNCPGPVSIHPCSQPSDSCPSVFSPLPSNPPPIKLHCYCDSHSTQSFISARDHRKKTERNESRERKVRGREESRQRKEEGKRREVEDSARRMREMGDEDGDREGYEMGVMRRLRRLGNSSRPTSLHDVEAAPENESAEDTKLPRNRLRRIFSDKDKERPSVKEKRKYTLLGFDGKDRD